MKETRFSAVELIQGASGIDSDCITNAQNDSCVFMIINKSPKTCERYKRTVDIVIYEVDGTICRYQYAFYFKVLVLHSLHPFSHSIESSLEL